jgi:uncharacterized membrane protein (UPF0127 family)
MRLAALPARELPGGVVVHEAVRARDRRRGLAGLPALPAARALHLRPCRAVHTFGMRFALDLVWLDAAGRVVRIDRSVPPRRHRACLRARSVLEVPAGGADGLARVGYACAVDRDVRPARRLTRLRNS